MESTLIEYLSLSGGGVKGTGFGGLIEGLERADIIKDLKGVSGASAGSNIAAFVAVGIPSRDIKSKALDLDLSQKLGSGYFGYFNDGKPVIEFVNDLLIYGIKQNITDISEESLSMLSVEEKREFLTFKASIDEQKEPEITFGHLALLRKIKPDKFKDLYITAVRKEDKQLEVFSTTKKESAEISIARACRASSSLPLLFTPADVDGVQYIDGGIKKNIPYDVFKSQEGSQQAPTQEELEEMAAKTLIVTLDENGRDVKKNAVYKTLHRSPVDGKTPIQAWVPGIIEEIMIWLFIFCGYLPKTYLQNANQEYEDIISKKLEFSVLNLDVEGLTVADFKTANEMGDEKYFKGYFSTFDHLINHDKLQHLSEQDYKTLVDKTRLQECFFKIITGAKLDRNSQLYKDLMEFCKDEKFQYAQHSYQGEDQFVEIRQQLNEAYLRYQQWEKDNPGGIDQDWEKAKAAYKQKIDSYNQQFKDVVYLKPVVESFGQIIQDSTHISTAKAKLKLQDSLQKTLNDPYVSSQNIKDLFKGTKFVEQPLQRWKTV